MPHRRSKQRHQTSLGKLLCLRAIKPRNRKYPSILLLHPRYEDNQQLWSKSAHKQIQPRRRDYHQNRQDLCCERSNSGWGSINWCRWWFFLYFLTQDLVKFIKNKRSNPVRILTFQRYKKEEIWVIRVIPTTAQEQIPCRKCTHQRRGSVLCISSKSRRQFGSLWRMSSYSIWRMAQESWSNYCRQRKQDSAI